jgi:hypothetical protein
MNDTEIIEKLLTLLHEKREEVNSEIESRRYDFIFDEWNEGISKGKKDILQEIQDFIDNIR